MDDEQKFVGNSMRWEKRVAFLRARGVDAHAGEQAYDINGKKLPTDLHRPIFIARSDEMKYDRVMTEAQA